jgi:hypothetical protein
MQKVMQFKYLSAVRAKIHVLQELLLIYYHAKKIAPKKYETEAYLKQLNCPA